MVSKQLSNVLRLKYQAEEHSHATNISLYEYEPKTPNEKLLWNVWKQVEIKNEVLQREKNSMLKRK
jgi:hypothetical protein